MILRHALEQQRREPIPAVGETFAQALARLYRELREAWGNTAS